MGRTLVGQREKHRNLSILETEEELMSAVGYGVAVWIEKNPLVLLASEDRFYECSL